MTVLPCPPLHLAIISIDLSSSIAAGFASGARPHAWLQERAKRRGLEARAEGEDGEFTF